MVNLKSLSIIIHANCPTTIQEETNFHLPIFWKIFESLVKDIEGVTSILKGERCVGGSSPSPQTTSKDMQRDTSNFWIILQTITCCDYLWILWYKPEDSSVGRAIVFLLLRITLRDFQSHIEWIHSRLLLNPQIGIEVSSVDGFTGWNFRSKLLKRIY